MVDEFVDVAGGLLPGVSCGRVWTVAWITVGLAFVPAALLAGSGGGGEGFDEVLFGALVAGSVIVTVTVTLLWSLRRRFGSAR